MEKRRLVAACVILLALLGAALPASADAPAPAATHARKKKKARKPAAPKASMKCATDDDCAFTAYEDGACCPMLCPPRVVSKASAEALKKYGAECKKPEGGCPVPECAPPQVGTTGVCVSGKCQVRAALPPTRE